MFPIRLEAIDGEKNTDIVVGVPWQQLRSNQTFFSEAFIIYLNQ